jgi:hypothetical protein
MNAKLERVTRLVFLAENLGLYMPPAMAHANLMDIAAVYNGIGPAWAPEWLREALTSWLACFQPAALVHDFAYSQITPSPAAEDLRAWADEQFYSNCRRCAAAAASWYTPRRWRLEVGAFLAWRAVRRLGGLCI